MISLDSLRRCHAFDIVVLTDKEFVVRSRGRDHQAFTMTKITKEEAENIRKLR
jgi:hypothetical protein